MNDIPAKPDVSISTGEDLDAKEVTKPNARVKNQKVTMGHINFAPLEVINLEKESNQESN